MKTINVDDFVKWLKDDTDMKLLFAMKVIIEGVVNEYANKYGLEVVQKQLENEEKPNVCIGNCTTCKYIEIISYIATYEGKTKCKLDDKTHHYTDCCKFYESRFEE